MKGLKSCIEILSQMELLEEYLEEPIYYFNKEIEAFIKRHDLSRDRDEQRPERFSVGQTIDARVTVFDKKTRKVALSIKALEIAEEKEAVKQYGSSDSGASLGDILGAALKDREGGDD